MRNEPRQTASPLTEKEQTLAEDIWRTYHVRATRIIQKNLHGPIHDHVRSAVTDASIELARKINTGKIPGHNFSLFLIVARRRLIDIGREHRILTRPNRPAPPIEYSLSEQVTRGEDGNTEDLRDFIDNLTQINDFVDDLDKKDLIEEITKFLYDNFTETWSQTIILRFIHGYFRQEIADYMGVTENTIIAWEKKGLEEIKIRFQQTLKDS